MKYRDIYISSRKEMEQKKYFVKIIDLLLDKFRMIHFSF